MAILALYSLSVAGFAGRAATNPLVLFFVPKACGMTVSILSRFHFGDPVAANPKLAALAAKATRRALRQR